jgi:RNA polymerase sigma-70 factor, ECF subfamily
MGTAQAARGGRRHNLSLRTLASPGARREQESVDRAFDSFYREHVADVYQYALAVLTNPTDAEDVTQQTFLNAYRAFQRGERPHTPHNWLIKIAHNVCRMRWRQSSRRPQEVSLENAAEPAASEDEKPSLDAVLSALSRLPFNQRAAIVMREVEGRSYAEIAEVLTTTVPAVEALLFRARSSLRARGKELGVLTVVPVPGSLTTFLGGGGVAASGGALVGSGVALKAVAVVATGVVAGGLGFKSVEAIADPEKQAPPAQTQSYQAAPAWASPVSRLAAPTRNRPNATFAHRTRGRAAAGGLLAKAPTNDRRSDEGLAAAPAAGSGAAAGAGAVVPPGGTILADPAATVNKIVASVPIPPVPPVPPTPPPPVELPPPPTVPTLPAVTITVPTVTLPPPPTLK